MQASLYAPRPPEKRKKLCPEPEPVRSFMRLPQYCPSPKHTDRPRTIHFMSVYLSFYGNSRGHIGGLNLMGECRETMGSKT
jgi:hypothetical protein